MFSISRFHKILRHFVPQDDRVKCFRMVLCLQSERRARWARRTDPGTYFFFLPKMPPRLMSSPMEAANWRSNSFWEPVRPRGTASFTDTN